uniref:Uncharacterized protein n=1 Tax=Anguilla anguilla TaxID=7936 RepID=A0A0E9TNU7_ANGAN
MGLLASCLQDVSLKRGGDCCWRKKRGCGVHSGSICMICIPPNSFFLESSG